MSSSNYWKYIDKYFEIITGRYIPGILGTKRNVKAVGMRSDSVVGNTEMPEKFS